MFKKNTIPQRKKFSMTKNQIMDDIERIHTNEDQRNKLYYCIDEKPPHDNRLKKLEEFLTGEVSLQSVAKDLENMTTDLETLSQEIHQQVENLKTKSEKALIQNT